MGSMSIWHWVIVALVVLLLFGKGRISEMMGDLAKGIKSFKKGLADEENAPSAPAASTPAAPPAQVTQQQAPTPTATPDQAPR
ncbi:twin-arginine translocase TatA/TatE family subunit [Sandaracinobacter sp. RS1-74]|uniref:twin-arginine translocase TatA/TatE family subunit n=1 Tax=Sandaracinobacteroides sayramensis TaxID=2913411 RepID=UPI001EDB0067|nr:twin-arginine translocase TatA/TatE family subunit [Sandaracinobacteroides sayramensis]MCG2839784.1 twin-arginine translocase TatA/TatE family subunit [Sandaracinobacteroides sayramensis]